MSFRYVGHKRRSVSLWHCILQTDENLLTIKIHQRHTLSEFCCDKGTEKLTKLYFGPFVAQIIDNAIIALHIMISFLTCVCVNLTRYLTTKFIVTNVDSCVSSYIC